MKNVSIPERGVLNHLLPQRRLAVRRRLGYVGTTPVIIYINLQRLMKEPANMMR